MCDVSAALSMRELAFEACPTGISAIDQMGKVRIQSCRARSGPARRNTDPTKTLMDIQVLLEKKREMDAWKENTLKYAETQAQQRAQAAMSIRMPVRQMQKSLTGTAKPEPELSQPAATPGGHKRHKHKRH